MSEFERMFLGASRNRDDSIKDKEYLKLKYANRHGLVTGATGTGKTVTMQILAEGFSNAGVPVFCSDIKGDLSGIAAMGEPNENLSRRADMIGLDPYRFQEFPVIFWDLFGEKGHPIRTTISEMGPLLLSRLMDCTDAQQGIINIAFRLADEEGLLLLDMKDLRAMLSHMAEQARALSHRYGSVNRQSIGAIQRKLLVLEQQHADLFFGEPALKISDIMRTTPDGRGAINLLAADRLMMNPRLYATFLLWLLSELFEELPEVGDPERPRLVFFFDEAHILFNEAPRALLERVELVVRLIRSKGVGVYFVTQNPLDVPDKVLSQLGNRVQHALRAYTPRERRAVKTAAETFRPNPDFDSFEIITRLAVGEALVSTLEKKGVPGIVQRTLIRPPASRLGPLGEDRRTELVKLSPVFGLYDEINDRQSAYEMLKERAGRKAAAEQAAQRQEQDTQRQQDQERRRKASARSQWQLPDHQFDDGNDDRRGRSSRSPSSRSRSSRSSPSRRRRASSRQTVTEAAIKSLTRSLSTQLGRAIARGILGGIKRGF